MSEVATTMRSKVLNLENVLRSMPQVELPTTHHFAGGMYARVMELKKGITIVGKVHKSEHFFILSKGILAVAVDDKVTVIKAPAVIVSGPGVKRAGHAIEDCVCINVHRSDKTDLDELEYELTEPDPLSMYDSANLLKNTVEALT